MTLVELDAADAPLLEALARLSHAAAATHAPRWLPTLDDAREEVADATRPGRVARVLLGADARPLACRVHASAEDPARCEPSHPGFATLRRPPLWRSPQERGFEQRLALLGQRLGLPGAPNLQWSLALLHDHALVGGA